MEITSEMTSFVAGAGDTPERMPCPRWIISDTHLGHGNILDYCPWRRSWAQSLDEHDAAIVAAWRSVVAPNDVVLHLGDVALGSKERLGEWRRMLPGRIVLVRGNHDRSHAIMRAAGFDVVCSAMRVDDADRHWICRHNPAAFTLRDTEHAARLLHGHCHGNGLDQRIHRHVRDKARDCSLDALRSIGPVPWDTIA